MSYFRDAIDKTTGYIPGEQPKPGTKFIKLNTNENPYPPSPKAIKVLRNLDSEWLRRYPDAYAKDFCSAVSDVLNIPQDWIIVGNGSDELLNVIVRASAEGNHRSIVYPLPTYVLYRTLATLQPAKAIEIDYPQNFQLPIDKLVEADGAVTFIASPNSPSGHIVPLDDLKKLARRLSGILVIDEAYVDFAEYSALPLVEEFDNIIILRTLSKGYSLAGLRMGFGIANPKLLSGLFKVKDSYNIDAIATLVGTEAIKDREYQNECVRKVKESRTKLIENLRSLKFTVLESHGNFVLATPPNNNAKNLYLGLKEKGILVRYFDQPGLDNKLRITVGTEAQNNTFLQVLQTLDK